MTDTMTPTDTRDPAEIERDIRRTQEDMSRTVDKIGDQLTMRNVFNALLDKADDNDVDARMLVDGARRNPIALGLIAAGAIWLVSDKDSKFPALKGKSNDRDGRWFGRSNDVHHRDYVSHMSAVEMRDGEDPIAYQRRRDLARGNFFMAEQRHDEDDHGFRQRLDELGEKFRDKRQAWSDSSSRAGTATRDKARMAAGKTQEMYDGNPLVGGILAAALGAALGSALPISRQEQEKLGDIGTKARSMVREQKDQLTEQAMEKKDELLDKADRTLESSGNDRSSAPADEPFMLPEGRR